MPGREKPVALRELVVLENLATIPERSQKWYSRNNTIFGLLGLHSSRAEAVPEVLRSPEWQRIHVYTQRDPVVLAYSQ